MSEKVMRQCFYFAVKLPPETEHYFFEGDEYCTDCTGKIQEVGR